MPAEPLSRGGIAFYMGAAVAAAPIVGYNVGVGNDEKIRETPRAARRLTAGLLPFVHTGGLMRILTYITTEEDAGRAARSVVPAGFSSAHTPFVGSRSRAASSATARRCARTRFCARGSGWKSAWTTAKPKPKPKSRPRSTACRRPSSAISTRICRRQQGRAAGHAPLRPYPHRDAPRAARRPARAGRGGV